MLHLVTEPGLRPEFVVGAILGADAYCASDPTPRGVARIDQLWPGLIRRRVMPMRLSDLFPIALRRDCRVDPCGPRRLLEEDLRRRLLKQAPIRMAQAR